jgi:hypothetical protein
MYVGDHPNPRQPGTSMAMTYQNIWGLSPHTNDRRAVIGDSVFLPMLLEYPKDTHLVSLADEKFFKLAFLDQFPEDSTSK